MTNAITTTHNLDFLACTWEPVVPLPYAESMMAFRVGTCHGVYYFTDDAINILAIANDTKGNGHFKDVMEWFEFSCRENKKPLRFVEVMNQRFKAYLLKNGFKKDGNDNVIKKF